MTKARKRKYACLSFNLVNTFGSLHSTRKYCFLFVVVSYFIGNTLKSTLCGDSLVVVNLKRWSLTFDL